MSVKIVKSLACVLLLLAVTACATSAQSTTATAPADSTLPTSPPPTESVASPVPTQTPPQVPAQPAFAPLPAPRPNGFASFVFDPVDASLNLYDLQGRSLAVHSVPPSASSIQIVGGVVAGGDTVLLVSYEWEKHALTFDDGGTVSTLAEVPHLAGLASAAGQPVLAYSNIEYLDRGASTASHLYVGSPQTLQGAKPVLSVADTEGYAFTPLAVRAEEGQPLGVWVTWEPQGIGGEIVFAPRSGLSYVDLVSGARHEVLGRDANPAALSPDQARIAYSTGIVGPLSLRNLADGQEVTFPLLADSDRGAGNAVFAPDNQHVAWMEAGGTLASDPPTFHVTIRVATTTGEIVAEIPGTTLTEFAGGSEAALIKPVGWLDAQTLILQVYSPDTSQLLRVTLDGSALDHLAPGSLVGFLYP